jgi:hypothetical protein
MRDEIERVFYEKLKDNEKILSEMEKAQELNGLPECSGTRKKDKGGC